MVFSYPVSSFDKTRKIQDSLPRSLGPFLSRANGTGMADTHFALGLRARFVKIIGIYFIYIVYCSTVGRSCLYIHVEVARTCRPT